MAKPAQPPKLPPRSNASSLSHTNTLSTTLSPESTLQSASLDEKRLSPNYPYGNHGDLRDPRSSSTQSLHPAEDPGPNRRTLLIIYIHGFLGNETSFRSFPAHVHMLLTSTLSESYVVHTKIYPRYKSRGNVTTARDDFSKWLAPHESPLTDVILVGHSLGGIVGAEVVLLPSRDNTQQGGLRHRIIGLIAFDTPFLGMHPGVVTTGIASLFRSAPPPPPPPARNQSSTDWLPTFSSSASDASSLNDPNYNPPFPNDKPLAERHGKMNRAIYFWNKHCSDLSQATQSYVKSHLEFGGCLADYQGLRSRYSAIRSLEDVEQDNTGRPRTTVTRVRFVNYYSASTGRIKERPPTPDHPRQSVSSASSNSDMQHVSPRVMSPSLQPSDSRQSNPSPRISVEEHIDGGVVPKELEELSLDPCPETAEPLILSPPSSVNNTIEDQAEKELDAILPPVPEPPSKPDEFDESKYTDKPTLKLAKKEHSVQLKAYERAVKDREKIIKRREKFREDRRKAAEKERAKAMKAASQQQINQETGKPENSEPSNAAASVKPKEKEARKAGSEHKNPPKQKDRKFCTLPKKDPRTGQRDPTWVRVYMEGMDEVTAHTSMFLPGEAYSKLVSDAVERIESWVHDNHTTRMISGSRSSSS